MSPRRQFKVAAVQASSVTLDAQANVAKAITILEDAAKQGAQLVVFSELFLSGYPFWIWLHPYGEIVNFTKPYYQRSALTANGPEANLLSLTCRRLGIRAVIGYAERDHGSLYMSQWMFGPDGSVVSRRKLKPSIMERVVFGEGNGSDLVVVDTEIGRVGALQCWEHTQLLIKHNMATQHEEIHCASWPAFPPKMPHYSLSRDANSSIIQSYAVETSTFVIASTSPLTQANIDIHVAGNDDLRELIPVGGGYTQIFSPEGQPLCSEPAHDAETVLYADVDLDDIFVAKSAMDAVGHYSRPDVFAVTVTRPEPRALNLAIGAGISPAAASEKVLEGGRVRKALQAAPQQQEVELAA
ncbi:carbon-nitrogen hydrolase family protein [Sporobolomyces koalae]|uniref:carbon-nitrogen hydrolase family protein n=1 Tax=Sporobolomyces koalae TaxID=500713 RepID=UPI0031778E1C